MNIDSLQAECFSQRGRVVLLFGGMGYERDVSVSGARRFLNEARGAEIDFMPVFISPDGDFYVFEGQIKDLEGDFSKHLIRVHPMKIGNKSGFLKDGELIPVGLVFPLLHGDFGEDGVIQGLLASFGMRFVGADSFGGAVSSDKIYSKIIAEAVGVPVLRHIAVLKGRYDIEKTVLDVENSFGFPVFVKPARLGSSIGASFALNRAELERSLDGAFAVAERVMIEPFIHDKRELECAYYNVSGKKVITPPAEVSFVSEFYDYNTKYNDTCGVSLITRADIKGDVCERIISYTDILSDALSVRHLARFDYFLLPDGALYFNEVNTMPGMTELSLYPTMLEGVGISFSKFLKSFLEDKI